MRNTSKRSKALTVLFGWFLLAFLFGLGTLGENLLWAQAQTPLNPKTLPQFTDPLPIPFIWNTTSQGNLLAIHMREFKASVLPTGFVPATGTYTGTWTWGYVVGASAPTGTQNTYLGPIIIARRDVPTEITFYNNLGSAATTNVLAYKNSTDLTLHWADPDGFGLPPMAMGPPGSPWNGQYSGSIPAAVHLHGGEVPPQIDGGPDSWFLSDGSKIGPGYYSKDGVAAKNYTIYRYPNSQEAAPIWFHDHTLGATRLNVYAGIAGGYLITDPVNELSNLPGIVPLIIQDRMFDTNGQLYFPAGVPFIPNPEHPYWVPEFVGDTIAVNGKVWPFFNVEPKRYRFLFLNGSNARTYEMFLVNQTTGLNGPALWQIGTDGGYLDSPVKIDPNLAGKLVLMPGERADVIIDFAGLPAGTRLLLRNTAKTPYPGGGAVQGGTTGRIVQFRVVPLTAADTTFNPAAVGATLRGGAGQGPALVRLVNPATGTLAANVAVAKTRQLTLNEVMGMPSTWGVIAYPGGPLEILVNNTKWSGKGPMDETRTDFTGITIGGETAYYSELPAEGTTEVWEIINLTADAHPIHTHLTQFQILNRQKFDVKKFTAAYSFAFLGGGMDPMTGAAYPANVYMPSYGPPLNYNTVNADGAVGGNPAVSPYLKGIAAPPLANEAGWKDTIMSLPGQVTRIVVRYAPNHKPVNDPDLYFPFDPSGGLVGGFPSFGYVWHCHIIDHEDNEMMRPLVVWPKSGAIRAYFQTTDY